MKRRNFILGALLAPLAITVGTSAPQVIGADVGAGVNMMVMGNLAGTAFVTVPRENVKLFEWLIVRKWECSKKQLHKDSIQLELRPI